MILSILYSRISRHYIEIGTIPLSAFGMSLTLYISTVVQTPLLLGITFLLFGVFGGMFVVPLNALIQFNAKRKLLGTILAAYKDFEDRFEIIGEKLPALEMVRKATKNKIGKFSKQDIRELCPSLSISSIEGSLRTLVKEGELMRGGSGKATYYVRLM